jgi:hypothetical protein
MIGIISMLFNGQTLIKLGSFIFNYWKQIAIASTITILVYQNTSETQWLLWLDTIPYYQNKLIETRKALDVAVKANHTLTAAIETTNKQVQEWKQVSKKLEQDNAMLSVELSGLRKITLNQAKDIIAGPTPVGCEASIEFLRDSIVEIQFNKR